MIDTLMLFTESLMKGPFAIAIYILGITGTFVMISWVPVRILWVLIALFRRYKNREKKDEIAPNLLLFLSIIPFIEFIIKAVCALWGQVLNIELFRSRKTEIMETVAMAAKGESPFFSNLASYVLSNAHGGVIHKMRISAC